MPNKVILAVDDYGNIPVEGLNELIDTSKVVSYSLKSKKDGSLILKLYDEKGKLVKPYGK